MHVLLKISSCLIASFALASAQDLSAPNKNPFDTAQDLEQGGRLFQTHCSYCHGSHGEGGRGADLTAGQYRYGGSDAELFATVRRGIPGTEMGPVRASDEEIWRMVGFVKKIGSAGLEEKAPGDPAAGKLVYDGKGGCATCHKIDKRGGNFGPDLTDVGRRRGLAFLRESLEKPDAYVAINYRAIRVITKSGQTVTGLRLNEDDVSIQLRDMGDNLRSYLKENLKEIQYDHPSAMPAYGSVLNKKEMEDLLAYMNSLRGAR